MEEILNNLKASAEQTIKDLKATAGSALDGDAITADIGTALSNIFGGIKERAADTLTATETGQAAIADAVKSQLPVILFFAGAAAVLFFALRGK